MVRLKKPKTLGIDLSEQEKETFNEKENRRNKIKHLQLGSAVYERRCASCHGVTGDGNGLQAHYMDPYPRDYRKGIFKFTSTTQSDDTGWKPRRDDLVLTLRRGVPGTSMPSFARLDDAELQAVVDYVIALSMRGEFENKLISYFLDDWEEGKMAQEDVDAIIDEITASWKSAENQLVQPVTQMPPFTKESIEKGQQIFLAKACNKCHGVDGRGTSDVGKDDWGYKATAADLTSGLFRGGESPIDIYRKIHAGIHGTPMPDFYSQYFKDSPDDIWYLVHFISDMGQRRRLKKTFDVGEDDVEAISNTNKDGSGEADTDASEVTEEKDETEKKNEPVEAAAEEAEEEKTEASDENKNESVTETKEENTAKTTDSENETATEESTESTDEETPVEEAPAEPVGAGSVSEG